MPRGWVGSRRRATLPPDWERRRRAVRERAGGICEECRMAPGTDCDHVDDPLIHELWNLAWLCHPCHDTKTKRTRPIRRDRRPPEQHPGLRR